MKAKVNFNIDVFLDNNSILVYIEDREDPSFMVSLKKLIQEQISMYKLSSGKIPVYHREDLENLIKLFNNCANLVTKELDNVE
jgi:hypothetical protein